MARTEGFHFYLALGELSSGLALGGLGQLDEAIDLVSKARTEFESIGHAFALGWVHMSPGAIFLAQIGRMEEAIDTANDAASTSKHALFRTRALIRLAEVLQLAGDDGHPGAVDLAESRLHEAIGLARANSAKGWELEAVLSLATLWRDQGKRRQAYDLLAPLYDWFTDGNDAPILQEAKALLTDLS